MAQLTDHINSNIVRTTLNAATNVWRLLIVHVWINMWSRYKPTRGGAGSGLFWKGDDGRCGFNLPTLSGNIYTPENWEYLKPRGGALLGESFRAGDFRWYDHDPTLKPPFYSFTGINGNEVPEVLSPVPSDIQN
jgi:hypothetical protein